MVLSFGGFPFREEVKALALQGLIYGGKPASFKLVHPSSMEIIILTLYEYLVLK